MLFKQELKDNKNATASQIKWLNSRLFKLTGLSGDVNIRCLRNKYNVHNYNEQYFCVRITHVLLKVKAH